MEKNKKIWLVAVLVLIIGAIWYLDSLKVHPTGSASAPQQISLSNTTTTVTVEGTSTTATSTPANLIANSNLQAIAAIDKKAGDQPAIEIADPTGFINAPSNFTLKSLIGKKVILVDFWTYSCINCIRTLPYITAWYQKYQNQGLEIVGIHTPEFDFEKDYNNVSAATRQYGINYPVIMDSNYGTWDAYNNLYWPHEYLIDIAGYIVHDHVGEGSYDETEGIIQKLLDQRAIALGINTSTVATSTVDIQPSDLSGINSPETYFGADRNSLLGNGTAMTNGIQTLVAPSSTQLNTLYLTGSWNFDDQFATNNQAGAEITYKFDSDKVFFVASSANASAGVTVQVLEDGQPISPTNEGSDVHNGVITITGSRLYNVVNNATGSGEHTLQLIVNSPGLQAFTFTFG